MDEQDDEYVQQLLGLMYTAFAECVSEQKDTKMEIEFMDNAFDDKITVHFKYEKNNQTKLLN